MLKSCEKVETNVYALEISMEGEAFKSAVSKAYIKNRGRYNVPGFRKGKAPKHIIEMNYGKEVFWYDVVDAEYANLFDEAVKEAGITPVAAPFDDELTEINENGFTVKLKVTVKPEVELKAYKGIKAEKEKVTVKKSEVKEEVERALERMLSLLMLKAKQQKKVISQLSTLKALLTALLLKAAKVKAMTLNLVQVALSPALKSRLSVTR